MSSLPVAAMVRPKSCSAFGLPGRLVVFRRVVPDEDQEYANRPAEPDVTNCERWSASLSVDKSSWASYLHVSTVTHEVSKTTESSRFPQKARVITISSCSGCPCPVGANVISIERFMVRRCHPKAPKHSSLRPAFPSVPVECDVGVVLHTPHERWRPPEPATGSTWPRDRRDLLLPKRARSTLDRWVRSSRGCILSRRQAESHIMLRGEGSWVYGDESPKRSRLQTTPTLPA